MVPVIRLFSNLYTPHQTEFHVQTLSDGTTRHWFPDPRVIKKTPVSRLPCLFPRTPGGTPRDCKVDMHFFLLERFFRLCKGLVVLLFVL